MRYEVETDLVVHCKVKVIVDAADKDAAVDAVAEQMPHRSDLGRMKAWKAGVDVTPPKGVELKVVKAYFFEQASGREKVRKIV